MKIGASMTQENHISALRERKNSLDLKIQDEQSRPVPNEVKLHSLKAKKLSIKDEIFGMTEHG
jgi:hypothetical protein|tara:strand:+ start:292996 stop:293184 length:189 start_codon:yes stop_codon:yes gene_type:complete